MQKLSYLVLLLALLTGRAGQASTVVIKVGDNFYSPLAVTIHAGDVITWQFTGTSVHPTVSDNGAWPLFILSQSTPTYSLPFNTTGSFPYHCTAHGGPGVGMYGIITVVAALPVQPAQPAAVFRVYPNPATTTITTQLGLVPAGDHQLMQLLDPTGRLVRALDVSPAATGRALTLNVADLPTGLYICRLLVNGQVTATQKLVLSP